MFRCILLIIFFSCSVNAASLPRYGGTLKIWVDSMPQSLDPVNAVSSSDKEVCSKIYSTLPEITKSYDNLKDGLLWVFYIFSGVRFHNSKPLTADDVKLSFERVANDSTSGYIFNAVHGVEEYRSGKANEVTGIKVADSNTLEINMRYLDDAFLQNLSLCAASILSMQDLSESGDKFWDLPVGSGPFKFVRRDENEIILNANDEYFEGRPYLDEIRFSLQQQ